MALKPPSLPLRRRQVAPQRGDFLPRRAPGRPTAFPLLPAVAAALVLLGAAQLAFWWWEARLPGAPEMERVQTTGNPFLALARIEASPKPEGGRRQPWRLVAPTLPQNIQFGDAMGTVTVTIFSDPSCGPCREAVRGWTLGLPVRGVKQVYKFRPQDPARLTPGLLVELARRQGKVGDFWRGIQGAGTDNLDDTHLLTLLDRAGVPLAEQRAALTTDGAQLAAALEPDIQLAQSANLPQGPVVMVDDYVLDGVVLSPARLRHYVEKRLAGRQLTESDDLWLMRK